MPGPQRAERHQLPLYNGTIDYDFGSMMLVSATSYGSLDQTQVEDASAHMARC